MLGGAWGMGSQPPAPCPLSFLPGASLWGQAGERRGLGRVMRESAPHLRTRWLTQPCAPPPVGLAHAPPEARMTPLGRAPHTLP